jgi:hypothetical protein
LRDPVPPATYAARGSQILSAATRDIGRIWGCSSVGAQWSPVVRSVMAVASFEEKIGTLLYEHAKA